ncbi:MULTISPECIES: acyl-CoA dehydrogenase family protein [Pseudonocardia]|uniref:(R)-benzylsuccinyl-CoA dehydrogenase n=2 Tax=Pseudonocardia TaxID=1847 RepID=A0A1Y2N6D8_PSEAH|nr:MULTISPECIES: acyl-CoA dehydrogenase family protein [Pseudonocardia]OSY42729.1 (R)-benzylsuccinyl-CoA dehydrogenase [Pseudonocardia autotrophica]TDN77306.1 acyl-CoA dehydrogenase [Pseudonocardia autotrophica]BBG01328.1 acyl-CoA dehydrogenase [Pseudonocardia autotrophica]GEC24384.1 acyl-CoA dehydrogenase [Pseudonocardia saturnea]
MEFSTDPTTLEWCERVQGFLDDHIRPAEKVLEEQYASAADPFDHEPPIKAELKEKARAAGLWNLFLPDEEFGAGLTNLQYAPLAEITGHSIDLAPETFNCSPPDAGNMELLAQYGTEAQQQEWLRPLLDGSIRSCFAMTEPDVASSDPNNLRTRIRRDGDDYVINGHKWWTTGICRPMTKLIIVMGLTDPDAPPGKQHSMVLVPRDAPGIEITRSLPVFGFPHHAYGGHGEVRFHDVRVPVENVLGVEGGGFAIAQARLGPGRIHHCMRLLGHAERAVELMCRRAHERATFGTPLAEQGVVQEWIADARMDIEQARLLVMKTAWLMDTMGNKGARVEISTIKVVVPRITARIVDRAIQVFGGAGVSNDLPLANYYVEARYLQIGDGPDEVHKRAVARRELRKYAG